MEEYLSVEDISEILTFGRNKTYKLISQKDFPKIKIGNKILVPRSKFEDFMNRLVYKEYFL